MDFKKEQAQTQEINNELWQKLITAKVVRYSVCWYFSMLRTSMKNEELITVCRGAKTT